MIEPNQAAETPSRMAKRIASRLNLTPDHDSYEGDLKIIDEELIAARNAQAAPAPADAEPAANPPCMMPDGGECCPQYDTLAARLAELEHNQRLQDAATASALERAEAAEAREKGMREDAERLAYQYGRYRENVIDAGCGGLMTYEQWIAAIDTDSADLHPSPFNFLVASYMTLVYPWRTQN